MNNTQSRRQITCNRCNHAYTLQFDSCPRCGYRNDKPDQNEYSGNSSQNSSDGNARSKPSNRATAATVKENNNSSNESSVVLWVVVAACVGLFVIGFTLQDPTSPRHTAGNPVAADTSTPNTPTTEKYYVLADALNVRAGPSTSAEVVDVLNRWETIFVADITDGWAEISNNGSISGYASARYLTVGDGQLAEQLYCAQITGRTPANGETLSRSVPAGSHRLEVQAGKLPVVVKIKSIDQRDLLSFYIAARRTAAIADLPDGSYRVYFAQGQEWSSTCNRFVPDMDVAMDPEVVRFITDNFGRSSIVLYDFNRSFNGNFSPKTLGPDDF